MYVCIINSLYNMYIYSCAIQYIYTLTMFIYIYIIYILYQLFIIAIIYSLCGTYMKGRPLVHEHQQASKHENDNTFCTTYLTAINSMHNILHIHTCTYMYKIIQITVSLPNVLHLTSVGLDYSLLVLMHSLCKVNELCDFTRHSFTAAAKLVGIRQCSIGRVFHHQNHQRS